MAENNVYKSPHQIWRSIGSAQSRSREWSIYWPEEVKEVLKNLRCLSRNISWMEEVYLN